MKQKLTVLPWLFGSLLVLAGCGALFGSNPQNVRITSDPAGARVTVNGEDRGTTPLELRLPVDKSYRVAVEAAGYPAQSRDIQKSLSVGYLVLDVLFGLVPLVVDLALGTLHHLDPGDLHFQFAPIAAPQPQPIIQMPAITPTPAGGKDVQGGGGGTGAEATSEQSCCVNGAFYVCPSLDAVRRCVPPELAPCMMRCGLMDMNCPDKCLSQFPMDPSGCRREPSRDGQCN